MPTDEKWHNDVTASIRGKEQYGKGILPNPWFLEMDVHGRRFHQSETIEKLTTKIEMLSEPRFHTGSETSELMEALITMIGAKQILELGMHTGRSTLHFLRAIVGIEGAKVISIDARPTHDREFFAQPGIAEHFEFLEGWTPDVLKLLHGRKFQFVFVDSDHSISHSKREFEAILEITKPGSMICWHDVPEWQTNSHHTKPPVRLWLEQLIADGNLRGLILPSPEQLDVREEYGADYDSRLNPGLAVTIRT